MDKISSAQAAKLLGVSIGDLDTLVKQGIVHPAPGPDGEGVYSSSEIARIKSKRNNTIAEEAAQVGVQIQREVVTSVSGLMTLRKRISILGGSVLLLFLLMFLTLSVLFYLYPLPMSDFFGYFYRINTQRQQASLSSGKGDVLAATTPAGGVVATQTSILADIIRPVAAVSLVAVKAVDSEKYVQIVTNPVDEVGLDGLVNTLGPPGPPGPQGTPGADGVDGLPGLTGAQGLVGLSGTNGTNGANGTNGTSVADVMTTIGDLTIRDGANTTSRLAAGTSGQVLTISGGVPVWGSSGSSAFSSITGGTNTTAAMVVGTGATLTPTGTGTITANAFSGILPISNGGTGASTLTTNGVLFGNGTGVVQTTSVPASGQLLLGNASGVPTFTTLSGDATINSTGVLALINTGTAGTYGSGLLIPVLTTDAQGRVTGVTNTAISGLTAANLTAGDFSSKITSGTYTINISGNAATVTTNANLTGPITSVGNATSVAAQTGTGSTFVMNTSPTLVTPVLGAATATSINKLTLTAPATGSTLTIADGKTLTASNTLTFTGTDGTSFAFPSTSDDVVGRTVTQTLTSKTIAAGSNTISGLTNANLSGTAGITNANLANSSLSLAGNSGSGSVSLGGTLTLTGAGITSVSASGSTLTVTSTEADTLASVTGRGATTATSISTTGVATITSAGLLTASDGLTLTTGALNLTATSGTLTLSGLGASSISAGANALTFTSSNFNTTATGINSTAIGQTTAAAGKFTVLTSTGATDLANAGASDVTIATTGTGNVTIGNSTGTFALTSNGGLNVTTAGVLTGVPSVTGAGGLTIVGGTASGNTITLSSTSNATKGKVLFGTSGYDEVNNRLGIRTSFPNTDIQIGPLSNTNTNSVLIGGVAGAGYMINTTGTNYAMMYTNGNNILNFGFNTSIAAPATPVMTLLQTGFAGFGTATPDKTVDISGTLRSTGATDLANAGASNVTIATTGTGTVAIGNSTGTFALTSGGGLNVTTGGALTGVASIDTISISATGLTFAGAGTISSTTTGALTLDSGTTGTVNLATGNNVKTIAIGTGNAGNTFNIGTNNTVLDTINIGSALDDVAITGDQWSVTNAGVLTVASCTGCGGGGVTLDSAYTAGNTIGTDSGSNVIINLAEVATPTELTINNLDTAGTNALQIDNGISTGTLTNGILIEQSAAGTMTNAINIVQTAGTITNAINANGTGISLAELALLDNKTGMLIDDSDLTSGDGAGGTSSGSGLEAGTGGIGLLQGCANNEVLKWNEAGSTWGCGSSSYSKFVSTAYTNVLNDTGNTADQAATDVDVTTQTSATATEVLLGYDLVFTVQSGGDAWQAHVMPNGTAQSVDNIIGMIEDNDQTAAPFIDDGGQAIVSLDAGQVFDYSLDELVDGGTVTFRLGVLGYWAPVTTGADLAENYFGEPSLNPGDVVSLDESVPGGVRKSSGRSDEHVIGVVSTKPGIVLDDVYDHSKGVTVVDKKYQGRVPVAVGLAGRIPVNVSTENGPIKAGDYLTASSIPGVAMKATKAGGVLGQALFGHDRGEIGAVVMFINNSYSSGTKLTGLLPGLVQDSQVHDQITLSKLVLGQFIAQNKQTEPMVNLSEILTDRVMAGLEIITPKITTQDIMATGMFSMADKDGKDSLKLSANGDAFFSGVLSADIIRANRIEGLEILTNQLGLLGDEKGIASSSAQPAKAESVPGINIPDQITKFVSELFKNTVEFFGKAVFYGDITFLGRPTFNKDTAGHAFIKAGDSEVSVIFEKEYAQNPVVTVNVNLEGGVKADEIPIYAVYDLSAKGFKIRLSKPTPFELSFSWIALFVKDNNKQSSPILETPLIPNPGTSPVISEASQSAAPSVSPSPSQQVLLPQTETESSTPSASPVL